MKANAMTVRFTSECANAREQERFTQNLPLQQDGWCSPEFSCGCMLSGEDSPNS